MRRIGRLAIYLVALSAVTLLAAPSGFAKAKPKPKPVPVRRVTLYTDPVSGELRDLGAVAVDCVPPALQTPSLSNVVILTGGQSVRLTRSRTFLKYIAVVTCVDNTPPPPPSSPVTVNFSGSGSLQLAPFSLPVGEQFCWTSSWPDGADIGDPYGDFSAFDNNSANFIVDANDTPNECSYIAPGSYQLSINAEGNWTISIHA